MNASGALQSIRSNALYLQVQGVLQARQDAKTEEVIKKPKGLWLTLIPVAGIVHFLSLGSKVTLGYSASPTLAL